MKLFNVVISRLKVNVFITALGRSKWGLLVRELLGGRKCIVRSRAIIFNGMLIKNNYF